MFGPGNTDSSHTTYRWNTGSAGYKDFSGEWLRVQSWGWGRQLISGCQDNQSNVQVHSLVGAGLWQLSNLRNLCRESSFLPGRSESYGIPQLGDLMHPWRAVCIGERSSELDIWALLCNSWHWIQIGSWKSRWVVMLLIPEAQQFLGMQSLLAKHLDISRCIKK